MTTDLTPEQKYMCDISYLTKRKKLKNDSPELKIQKDICTYLKEKYPKVYFVSDALGLNPGWFTMQILLQTNSEHKHIDIFVAKRSVHGNFSGLFMEVKAETPWKKDGTIKKSEDDHLLKQLRVIEMLRLEGYKAEFTWTLDMTIEMLHGYLGAPVVDNKPLFIDKNNCAKCGKDDVLHNNLCFACRL